MRRRRSGWKLTVRTASSALFAVHMSTASTTQHIATCHGAEGAHAMRALSSDLIAVDIVSSGIDTAVRIIGSYRVLLPDYQYTRLERHPIDLSRPAFIVRNRMYLESCQSSATSCRFCENLVFQEI